MRLRASAAASSAPRTRQPRASSHPADTSVLFSLHRDSLQPDSSLPLPLAHRAPQRIAPSDEPGGSCPPVQPDRLLRLGPSTVAPPRSRARRRLFQQQPDSPTHVQSSAPSSRVGGSLRSGSSPQQNTASRVRRPHPMLFEVLIPQLPGKRGDAFYSSTGWFGEELLLFVVQTLSVASLIRSLLMRSKVCSIHAIMNQTTDLGNLTKGRETRAITVRVIRKWTVREDGDDGPPWFIGMVLADAKANCLYAEIPRAVMPNKEYLLDIGKVYIIKKVIVNNARDTYRPIDKSLMIQITDYTSIELAKDYPATIPEYVYNLTPFSSIVAAGKTVFKYTDVIGYITGFTALQTFVPKNKEKVTNLRKVYINNLSDAMLTVTLWGDHAINFNVEHVYNETAGNVIVTLFVGCIPRRDYKDYDKIYLSGSSALFYYFNPNIPEAAPFHARFSSQPVYIDRPVQTQQLALPPVLKPTLKFMTVADLDAIEDPFEFEAGTYKCSVIVASIPENSTWWYMSCKRHKNKAIQQTDRTYRCPVCNGSDTIPRYLLSFIGMDDTGEARFFAYDEEATQIIGRECQSIMNPLAQTSGIPQQLLEYSQQKICVFY
ncbi:uncharacterized protein [Miscanthus floridulus]